MIGEDVLVPRSLLFSDIKDLVFRKFEAYMKQYGTITIKTSAKSGKKWNLSSLYFHSCYFNQPLSELSNLKEANKRFEKSTCSHFNIFDFCFLDTLYLPSISRCVLVLDQQFAYFWTYSLWKVLIHLFWFTREQLNCNLFIDFAMLF